MAQAGTVWVDVRGDTAGLVRDIGTAAQTAGRATAGALGAGARTVLSDLGTAAGVAALGVAGIGGAAVMASTEFNKSMSGVSAVAGATAGEMEQLREAALKAGADTAFSASEAAVAQGELARAGVSVADILGGALAGSLGLAAAGQLELGQAAEISAQALNIFGLGGDQTTRVADVLAAGANKSAADVAQLGDALRQGGLVAAQTGLSLEETAGVLSMFADNALLGSDAGTSLKTFLQRLVPQSDEAAKAMESLGLQFFDSQGAFVGIEEVAGQLQGALGGLSDEQRNAALSTLFGSDAVRSASILMDGGAASVRDYTTAVSDQGAASRMAAEQLDNLAGDIEEFKGATETALIRVGDLFDGVNRSVVQSGTDLVNVFNDFATTPTWDAIQANIEELADVGGERLREMAGWLGELLSTISPADVDRFFGRIEAGFSEVSEAAEGLAPVIAGVSTALSTMALRSIPFVGALVPAFSPLTGALAGLVLGSDKGRAALTELGELAKDFAAGPGLDLLRSLSGLADEMSGALATAMSDVGGAVFDAADSLSSVLVDAIDELGRPLGDLIEAGAELASKVLPLVADVAGTVLPPAVDVLAGGLSVAADAVELLADNLWLLVPAFGLLKGASIAGAVTNLGTTITATASQAATAARDFGTYFSVLRAEGESIGGALSGASSASGGLAGSLAGALNPAVLGVTAAVSVGVGVYQAWSSAKKRAEDVTRGLADALLEEEDLLGVTAEALRANMADLGVEDAAAKAGLSIRQMSKDVRAVPGDFDWVRSEINKRSGPLDFGNVFTDEWGSMRVAAQAAGKEIPESVEQIRRAVAEGLISEDEGLELINALVDADKATQLAADNIVGRFADIKDAAKDLNIDLSPFIAEFEAATAAGDFETQKAVIDEIARRYPELADAAGIALGDIEGDMRDLATTTADAVGELRALAGELENLAGAGRNVDEAQRDLNDSIQRMLESIAKNGKGVDINTEAGRRNADAIQQMVEAGERLAESQALTDRSGETSRQTLKGIADQLGGLYEANVITSDEYARLISLYRLTPEQINTRVEVDISKASATVDEVQRKLAEMKGLSESDKVKIEAEIDAGNYEGVMNLLNALAADREAKIRAEAEEQELRVVTEKLNSLPGVTEPERAKILAELDGGNLAGVDALLNDLARARNAIITPLSAPIFRGFLPPAPMGGRAQGGPVTPGTWLVGEKGPELLEIPGGVSGNVVTNHESRARVADAFGVTVGGDGASIGGPMSMDPMSMRSSFVELGTAVQQMGSSITAAVASARPIVINGAVSPRRTAEELVVQESRMLRRVAR